MVAVTLPFFPLRDRGSALASRSSMTHPSTSRRSAYYAGSAHIAPLAHHFRSRTLTASPPTIGEIATTGTPRFEPLADTRHAEYRAMLTYGFEGHRMKLCTRPLSKSSRSAAGYRPTRCGVAKPSSDGLAASLHEVILKGSSPSSVTRKCAPVPHSRHDRMRYAEFGSERARDGRERLAALKLARAEHVHGEIAVAQPEPRLAPSAPAFP